MRPSAKIVIEDVSGRRDRVIEAVRNITRLRSARSENVVHAEIATSHAVFAQDEYGGRFMDGPSERPVANQRDHADGVAAVQHLALHAAGNDAEFRSDVSGELRSKCCLRPTSERLERVSNIVRTSCNQSNGVDIDSQRWGSPDILHFERYTNGYEGSLSVVGPDEGLLIVIRFERQPRPHVGRSDARRFGRRICCSFRYLKLSEDQPKAERIERKSSHSDPYRYLRRQSAAPSVTRRSLRRSKHVKCCRIQDGHADSAYRLGVVEAKVR